MVGRRVAPRRPRPALIPGVLGAGGLAATGLTWTREALERQDLGSKGFWVTPGSWEWADFSQPANVTHLK